MLQGAFGNQVCNSLSSKSVTSWKLWKLRNVFLKSGLLCCTHFQSEHPSLKAVKKYINTQTFYWNEKLPWGFFRFLYAIQVIYWIFCMKKYILIQHLINIHFHSWRTCLIPWRPNALCNRETRADPKAYSTLTCTHILNS